MPFEFPVARPRTSTRLSNRTHQSYRSQLNRTQVNRPQFHEAVCADCDGLTTVPFLPSQDRPVYCSGCFKARRNGLSSPVNAPVNGAIAATGKAALADGPHDVDAVFPGMSLKVATRAAISRMNISDPTPIQEKSIPQLLAGRDLIGQARTGRGKRWPMRRPWSKRVNRQFVKPRHWCWCPPANWPSRWPE